MRTWLAQVSQLKLAARARPRKVASCATSGSSSRGHGRLKAIHVAWRNRRGGVARDFRQRSTGRHHYRHTARHGFEHGQAKAFVERRQHEQVRPRKQIHPARLRYVTGQLDMAGEIRCSGVGLQGRGARRHATRQHQTRSPGYARSKLTVGRQQHADVLAWIERTQEQDVLARLAASSLAHGVRPRRSPGRAQVDALGRDAQRPVDVRGCVGGRHDNGRCALRVCTDQVRKVAAHFGRHAFRVSEEVEIVNGEHHRRRPAGDGHGSCCVHHVESSGQPLDRRPGHAIPRHCEQAARHLAIDHPGAWQFPGGVRRRTVLPRGGEERQLVRTSGSQQRLHQFVDILAHTGSLLERWAVVDENAHGWERSTKTASPCGSVC